MTRRTIIEAFVAALCAPPLSQLTSAADTPVVRGPERFMMVMTFGPRVSSGVVETKIRRILLPAGPVSVEVW